MSMQATPLEVTEYPSVVFSVTSAMAQTSMSQPISVRSLLMPCVARMVFTASSMVENPSGTPDVSRKSWLI